MPFPALSDALRLDRLRLPAGKVRMVLDTDTYNEIDDQFALVHIPCTGVSSHLQTTVPEIERHVEGHGAIGDYLAAIFKAHHADHFAWSKVIWDIAGIAWLIDSSWVPTELVHSPILTDQLTWSVDRSRHLVRFATYVRRDPIFRDLFTKLAR